MENQKEQEFPELADEINRLGELMASDSDGTGGASQEIVPEKKETKAKNDGISL